MGVCRAKTLLAAPLPAVWEFIIDPRNMHLWAHSRSPSLASTGCCLLATD
jgi:hypothetical protein